MKIDLNADLGESFGPWRMGDDAAMLGIVTTASIACGFHAGDPETMRTTISLARKHAVAVGAHPGYADLVGFGRRPQANITASEVENLVAYQVGAFVAMAALCDHRATHAKTHGALGNACADDDTLADAVARGIRAADPSLAFIVMPGTATERAAGRAGLRPIHEIYADRTYADSFNLTSRRKPGAVLHDPAVVSQRVLRMVGDGMIETVGGHRLRTEIHSVCVHGDTPGAVSIAQAVRDSLETAGWRVTAAQ